MQNRRWVLASHATGAATEANWHLETVDAPQPGPNQVLLRTRWLSVDPYMRGKLGAAGGMTPGSLMLGGGVGEVIESNHPDWKPGDIAEGLNVGWQELAVLSPDQPGAARLNKVAPGVPMQAGLSWLGMPGLTAYFAMVEVACPRPGDTVAVSAAAGAVGQIAGQIAKLAGCRVIGIAGSDEKLAWCRSIGFDETINYRTATDLTAAVREACPRGVNVFFDGTGGAVHDAVMANLALNARVAIVGKIAVANVAPAQDVGLRASALLIAARATVQGFVVYDWWHRRDEALQRLTEWHGAGALAFREDVVDGLENVPRAFVRMMEGESLGKQLVRL